MFYRVTCKQQHGTKFKKIDEDSYSEDGEEEGETAANDNEEISGEDVENPKTHRIQEKYTQSRETTTGRSEQMKKKNVSVTKKRTKTTARHPRETRKLQRCQQHPRNQICKEESAHYKS